MPFIEYVPKTFRGRSAAIVQAANIILEEYRAQGYILTIRQLYYQFVARDLFDNNLKNYACLVRVMTDARLGGYVDWDAIEDRTRNLHRLPTWNDPDEIVASCARQFRRDKWAAQPVRIEVWIEKQALEGVFQRICDELEVPFFSCRGYTSISEVWSASQRLIEYEENEQDVIILHFGDHDPSGVDMTRDLQDRFETFGCRAEIRRMALNMDQIRRYEPPPNPAKLTDSRSKGYIREYGRSSWELDALPPTILAAMVRAEVESERDSDAWSDSVDEDDESRQQLAKVATNWTKVVKKLK